MKFSSFKKDFVICNLPLRVANFFGVNLNPINKAGLSLGIKGVVFIALLLLFCGCKEERQVQTKIHTSYAGDIAVLNSGGINGAAVGMRSFLRRNGFDVVSMGDYQPQNFEETVLAVHTQDWEGAEPLAKLLNTKNVLYIKNKRAYVDATVYVGKDFYNIIQQDSP